MYINYTSKTSVISSTNTDKEVFIIGFCIDAYGQLERNEIPQYIAKQSGDIIEIYKSCKRFAGSFVILYADCEHAYIWGDATGSIQVNYGYLNGLCSIASTDKMAADHFGFGLSQRALKIREGADYGERLPYNLTMYCNIKILIPDHILEIRNKNVIRIPMGTKVVKKNDVASLNKIINKTCILVDNIIREYAKYYDLVCPLSSGYDSRVNFSFLRKYDNDIQCFTFWHKGFTEKTDDIVIPKKICTDYKQAYRIINDIDAANEYVDKLLCFSGPCQSKKSIDYALTYKSFFSDKALINGNNIGETGKSFTGHNVPTVFATPSFFQCKMYNLEPQIKYEIKRHIKEIKSSDKFDFVYDIYEVENFCGRWCSQGGMIYSLCGVTSLSIFNCREVILEWIRIPRSLRAQKWLHTKYLSCNDYRLLGYPFNPHYKFDFLRKSWFTFLVGTYAKQSLKKMEKKMWEHK